MIKNADCNTLNVIANFLLTSDHFNFRQWKCLERSKQLVVIKLTVKDFLPLF